MIEINGHTFVARGSQVVGQIFRCVRPRCQASMYVGSYVDFRENDEAERKTDVKPCEGKG